MLCNSLQTQLQNQFYNIEFIFFALNIITQLITLVSMMIITSIQHKFETGFPAILNLTHTHTHM